jgi:hypothetical protein
MYKKSFLTYDKADDSGKHSKAAYCLQHLFFVSKIGVSYKSFGVQIRFNSNTPIKLYTVDAQQGKESMTDD